MTEKILIGISQETIITLTPEIIAIMENAGITEADIKRLEIRKAPIMKINEKKQFTNSARGIPATEYILKSVRKCKLCGHQAVTSFYMKRRKNNPSILESVPIGDMDTTHLSEDIRYKVWPTCSHCEENLMELDKFKVVQMLIRTNAWRDGWK